MIRTWFVTGTDTGIGKTTVASTLLHRLHCNGLSTLGMKPVATGCHYDGGLWINEDVEQLVRHSSLPVLRNPGEFSPDEDRAVSWQMVNPYAFEPAIAPHIAAAQAGVEIKFSVIQSALHQLQTRAEAVVIEGAGGFRVPLGQDGDTAELCRVLAVPIILVVGMRLGCINHALLTVEALMARKLILAGWVANQVDPHMEAFGANLARLMTDIPAPCLGVVHFQHNPEIKTVPLTIESLLQ
ncbi:MAG: dethiobiotin synthase [Betaproteobacteria bacterium]|nr:dethiobiotin synthase [Betaproteobacteria bacterium]